MEPKVNKKAIIIVGVVLVLVVAGIFGARGIMNSIQESRNREEIEKVEQAFKERFSFMDGEYEMDSVKMISDEYAGVVVIFDGLTHKAVLYKDDNGWSVVGLPEMVLTYSEYESVPRDIIYSINGLKKGKI